MPRLLHVDGIDVEVPLERNLIYLRNQNVPGVIGRVGTILGKHQINITNFSIGRLAENEDPGNPREAVAVVHVNGYARTPFVPAPHVNPVFRGERADGR